MLKYTVFAVQKKKETETRFGVTDIIDSSRVRGLETMLSKRFKTTYGHKPVLCIQEGTTAAQTQEIITKFVALIDADLEYSCADMAKILTKVYREVTNNKTKKVKKIAVMCSAEKVQK